MERPKSKKLLAIAALLMVVAIGLQAWIDPDRQYYAPIDKTTQLNAVGNESKELLGGVLLGFREVAAGLLWVRADDYFHSGRYDDLVPIFYVVTWLDPHQLDVYSTGAWHLAYNLGDQRLIPEGVKFLDKGIRDNPDVYDLYFQQGWMNFNKIKNYGEAVRFFQEASKHPDTDGKPAPFYIDNEIAHGMEKNGQIDAMFKQWYANIAKTKRELVAALLKNGNATVRQKVNANLKSFMDPNSDPRQFLGDPDINALVMSNTDVKSYQDTLMNQKIVNLDTSILRRNFFRKGVGQPGYAFQWNGKPYPHWAYVGGNQRHQINAHFDYHVVKLAPRKIKIVGHIEGMDFYDKVHGHHLYTRLDVLLRDKDYDRRYLAHSQDFTWQKQNITWFYKQNSFPTEDPIALKPGRESTEFEMKLDFTKDPEDLGHSPSELFPFKADEYKLSVTMDPTEQSEFHQDVFGWKGEGITDPRYLVTDRRGVRLITKTIILKRSDLL
jgi:hypothetical protein